MAELPPLYDQLALEGDAMVRHALGRGVDVPPAVVDVIARASVGEAGPRPDIVALVKAHTKLAQIVAPAQPRGLLLLRDATGSDWGWVRLPLPRRLMAAALTSLACLLVVGTFPDVSADPDAGNPLMSGGWGLILNQLFFLAVAALGASFHGLFTVKRYIIEGTYDQTYAPTYWVRFMLGVISGLILASLIDIDENSSLRSIARPVLALIGGFSASVVHRVLERMVSTVESLLQGDNRALLAEHGVLESAKAEQRVRDGRADTAGALLALQAKLADGTSPEQVSAELRKLVDKLIPGGELTEAMTRDASPDTRPAEARPAEARPAEARSAEAPEQPATPV